MFALRFTPHQRQSSTALNQTPKTGSVLNYSASLIFSLEQRWRRVSGKAGVSSLYVRTAQQLVWGCHAWLRLAHISAWLLRLSTSWLPLCNWWWKAVAWQHFIQIVTTMTNKRDWLAREREKESWFQKHQWGSISPLSFIWTVWTVNCLSDANHFWLLFSVWNSFLFICF